MRRLTFLLIAAFLFAAGNCEALSLAESVKHETSKCLAKSALKQYAPYLREGLKESMKRNWKFISDSYNDKAEWSDALSRSAVDAAGYTVTPILVDGLLASSKSKFAVILKEADIGIFCWDAGKEFFSYARGEITQKEFADSLRKSAISHAETIPVKIMGYVISASGFTFIAPAVIIAGEFAIERLHAWYEFELWRNTVCTDDIRAVLGDELVRVFHLANPERRPTLSDPARHDTIASPKLRRSIANP